MLDAMSSMEDAHSSTWRHISNSARLAHSRLNPPFSRSQSKPPLFVEAAGELALSGVPSPSDSSKVLHVSSSSDSSEMLPRKFQVFSGSDSDLSEVLARELTMPFPSD